MNDVVHLSVKLKGPSITEIKGSGRQGKLQTECINGNQKSDILSVPLYMYDNFIRNEFNFVNVILMK